MKLMPTPVVPPPRRFRQENDIAIERHAAAFQSSITIRFAARLGLSSRVPRPQI